MLSPDRVTKYFGQADLWELLDHLRQRVNRGDNDPVEVELDKLIILVEQALWPAWFHGYLAPEGVCTILEPRNSDGCPEYGIISMENEGQEPFLDVCGCMTNDLMVEMLEAADEGTLISPVTMAKFIMHNPTLMKGFRFWIKQRMEEQT
jgi:hypothetical protein